MKKIVMSILLISALMVGCKDQETENEKSDETAMNADQADNSSSDGEEWKYEENSDSNSSMNQTGESSGNNNNGKNPEEMKRRDGLTEEKQQKLGMNSVNKKEVVYTFTRAEVESMATDFERNVETDASNAVRIRNYPTYTIMRGYVIDLSKSDDSNEAAREKTLRQAYNEFKRTVPSYLQRNDVIDAMANVEHRLNVYERERNMSKTSKEDNRENIDAIQRAFDDMEEEIAEVRKRFKENREDALEEFMEEINDKDPGKSRMERYRDALEEYNEEIED